MPELPELEICRERLEEALAGRAVIAAQPLDPFVLRTVEPPLSAVVSERVRGAERRGKHLRLRLASGLALDFHLMRAGRLRLRSRGQKLGRSGRKLFVLELEGDLELLMTEAGTERRAALRVLAPGAEEEESGPEPLDPAFTPTRLAEGLRRENRQLKGALRSREVVAGIGNAYSDEILHAARLSPLRLTSRLTDEEIERLHGAIVSTLREWIERVRAACPPGTLPEQQGVWRGGFAVHGRAGEACPVCGDRIERVSYRDSETDYCPTCQNEGRLLADRRRSRLGIPPRDDPPRPRD